MSMELIQVINFKQITVFVVSNKERALHVCILIVESAHEISPVDEDSDQNLDLANYILPNKSLARILLSRPGLNVYETFYLL